MWTEVRVPTPKADRVAGRKRHRDFVTEFDTLVDAERDAFNELMRQPLAYLVRENNPHLEELEKLGDLDELREAGDEGLTTEQHLGLLVLDGVETTWQVVTVIRNHHWGLNPRINMLRVTVADDEETLYVNIDKQPGS